MSLENLVGISLEKVEPDAGTIKRLLDAANRSLNDAGIAEVSAENRFDAAYKSIMQVANAALQANGYRTLTSKPGHHRVMIQVLVHTINLEKKTIIVLDALRKQRNVADYSGDIVPESAVSECVQHAGELLQAVHLWMNENKPEFVN